MDYLSMFPDRSIEWNPLTELWEIWNGDDSLHSILFEWEVSPDMEEIEMDRMMRFYNQGHPDVWKAFKPFDYPLVVDRRQDWWESQHLSLLDRLKANKKFNDRKIQRQSAGLAYEQAAAMGEMRRWLGPLADTWDIADGNTDSRRAYDDERIPQVAVATTFKE